VSLINFTDGGVGDLGKMWNEKCGVLVPALNSTAIHLLYHHLIKERKSTNASRNAHSETMANAPTVKRTVIRVVVAINLLCCLFNSRSFIFFSTKFKSAFSSNSFIRWNANRIGWI